MAPLSGGDSQGRPGRMRQRKTPPLRRLHDDRLRRTYWCRDGGDDDDDDEIARRTAGRECADGSRARSIAARRRRLCAVATVESPPPRSWRRRRCPSPVYFPDSSPTKRPLDACVTNLVFVGAVIAFVRPSVEVDDCRSQWRQKETCVDEMAKKVGSVGSNRRSSVRGSVWSALETHWDGGRRWALGKVVDKPVPLRNKELAKRGSVIRSTVSAFGVCAWRLSDGVRKSTYPLRRMSTRNMSHQC